MNMPAVLISCLALLSSGALASISISDVCFDLNLPANYTTTEIYNVDGELLTNANIGEITLNLGVNSDGSGAFTNAGSVTFTMQTDSSGYLIDNGNPLCIEADVSDVCEFEISYSANGGEWDAPLLPFSFDNFAVTDASGATLLGWNFSVGDDASILAPILSGPTAGFWNDIGESSGWNNQQFEFSFYNGGGAGASASYLVSKSVVPEPSRAVLSGLALLSIALGRRRL